MDYSIYIENETQEIKDLINKIFNHPLITGDNEKWIMQQNDFREFCSDGGTIDFYRIEDSVMGVAYIIKFLQKYKPKKILEVGMNVGSFSIIAKEVLGDVKIYSVDRQKGFVERQIQINDYYGEELISLLLSDSISNEFRNYAKENTPYDLAWIDGHHSEASSMFDIMTAINCGIPIICCDDCQPNTSTGVWKGIQKLVKNNLVKVLDYQGEITIIENVQEKDKVIWGYDRFENDLFVPNGYPNEQEYIEDTEKYLETFGKEKVVHNLFRELQTNQKLVDNISDNFLYPVEQFGAFDKLIGRDENYKEFCFLEHIKKSTLKKIQNGQGKIVILALEESRVELSEMIFFHNLLNDYNIKQSDVYYVIGNNWSLNNEYKNWCGNLGINIINSFEQLYLKGQDWFTRYDSENDFVELSQLVGEDVEEGIRDNHFVCFNRRIRPHRYALIAMLYHNNLLKNNLVSFSLERGKDLNHLGQNGPDLHTMNQIMGKTKLRDDYMSYYNELVNLSPMIVDYDNLTNVMGPGCESKEPYLNSYFSIVTETAFPEKTYFSTEKIYRPMLHFHPFIVYGSPYTLKNLRELGFKTFSPYIDESYDEVISPFRRMQKITKEVKRLCSMSKKDLHKWYYGMLDILEHNRELMKVYGIQYNEAQQLIYKNIYEKGFK